MDVARKKLGVTREATPARSRYRFFAAFFFVAAFFAVFFAILPPRVKVTHSSHRIDALLPVA